ncbi:MAG: hypothetical protein K8S87_12550 [Planctomycetes bacterium]|nr:hypothetical protein [Planctomycetota bacterium]
MFELRFYLKNDQSYDYQSVERFLLSIKHVRKSEKIENLSNYIKNCFIYLNERTGVRATFCNWQPDSDSKRRIKTDNLLIFPGFTETPMRFTLEFNKPSFFAREVMPIVSKFALEFEFFIFDAQNVDLQEPAIQRSSQLIENWKKNNSKNLNKNLIPDKQQILSLRRDLADDWWEYMFNLDEFQYSAPESVFVPEIILLEHKKSGQLFRAVTWADFMPVALPSCEKVAIIQTRGLYKIKLKNLGIYNCSELLDVFASNFSDIEINNRRFKVLSVENSENHGDDFAEILKKLKSQKSSKFKVLNSDNFNGYW